jgi:hypothetical protein
MTDDTPESRVRALFDRHGAMMTHWGGCEAEHVWCALGWALREIDRLRDACADNHPEMVS